MVTMYARDGIYTSARVRKISKENNIERCKDEDKDFAGHELYKNMSRDTERQHSLRKKVRHILALGYLRVLLPAASS